AIADGVERVRGQLHEGAALTELGEELAGAPVRARLRPAAGLHREEALRGVDEEPLLRMPEDVTSAPRVRLEVQRLPLARRVGVDVRAIRGRDDIAGRMAHRAHGVRR